ELIEELRKISVARRHKPFQPSTAAHKKFLQSSAEKTRELQRKYPFLDLQDELNYFTSAETVR
ncbi:MAG: GSCFA domain-containing protein, partial [Chitinophagaceae bacterium]